MKKFLSKITPDKSDTLLFAGLGFVFYGIWQVNQPLAFGVVGTLFMGIGYLNAPKGTK